MPLRIAAKDQYSLWMGLVYVFNLIVGTGALTLPAAYAKAGWILSTVALVLLGILSYLNTTYVIETMASANAVLKWNKRMGNQGTTNTDDSGTRTNAQQPVVIGAQNKGNPTNAAQAPLANSTSNAESLEPLMGGLSTPLNYFTLEKQVELGEMANLFFNKTGRFLFYSTICVYLFGDVAIYAAAVAKTLVGVSCTKLPGNYTKPKDWHHIRCFGTGATDIGGFTRQSFYRLTLILFVGSVGSFAFFNVQKTKILQLFTTVVRWLAFGIMISMACHILLTKGAQGHPVAFDLTGTPTLFGACVYSFMCQHSLPSLITPIRPDRRLGLYLAYDFILIAIFYIVLACTGAFAFAHVHDLYTLNFVPDRDDNIFLKFVQYFLSLFPVFTLSTSFPIICITLRNNLMSLCLDMTKMRTYSFFIRRILFPIVVIVPPTILTLFMDDIAVLIAFTGSYAGTGIQYLIPTFLVIMARRHTNKIFGPEVINQYSSPFKGTVWGILVLLWSVLCVVMVSVHLVQKKKH